MSKMTSAILGGIIQNTPPSWIGKAKYWQYKLMGSKALSFRTEKYSVLLTEALKTFLSEEEQKDKALVKELSVDIEKCAAKLEARPDEYFLLGFRNLSDDERKQFLVDNLKDRTLLYVTGRKKFMELKDKYMFYQRAGRFFKRGVMLLDETTSEQDFSAFALRFHSIFCKKIGSVRKAC